ncbi:copper transporter [Brevibacterium sp. UCMA 11754]|uniref:copper transporter n=1 Tax=Brevibacterium sp. UCMA 11754 TaxID=2749198 RepID=UPI001F3DD356|nr:copper transporter [Brevibacterium sp. UCMA 11754]MCF2572834.1 copper transporter [Brevibacterium sp. UCMA 11754]
MIDFRYHLVSLVSVFLALAVGIVLGAGPLKEPIGESLQSQVDSLRADRDDLRAKIDAANGNIDKQNDFVTSAAPELIGDTLKGEDVSIIGAPNADPEQVEEVTNRIKEAGGKIGGDVSFVDNTLSLKDSKDFLKTLRDSVPSLPKDDSTALRSALVIALTGKATMLERGQDRDAAEKKSSGIFDAFVDAGRLRTDTDHKPTSLFVVIDDENSKLADETEPSPEATNDKANRTLITDFINSLTSDSKSVVVAGDAGSAQNGLVSILRTEKSRASTVDGLGLGAGAVITVRALAAGEAGTHGHYGFSDDAEEIMPGKGKD